MWKNYMLAALNVAVAGLPFLVGWDLVLYGVYCGFAVLLLGLTAWNPVGDWLSILFVFYANVSSKRFSCTSSTFGFFFRASISPSEYRLGTNLTAIFHP